VTTDVAVVTFENNEKTFTESNESSEVSEERLPALEALLKCRTGGTLVLGKPGIGKTTVLGRFMLEQATRAKENEASLIPVLVHLKLLSRSANIVNLIISSISQYGTNFTEDLVKGALISGKLILLFDGLNELPSEDAERDLARFLQEFSNSMPMIFTSRYRKNVGFLKIKTLLNLQPLSRSQIDLFVRNFAGSNVQGMISELRDLSPNLTQNPFLLERLCGVFRKENRIPHNLGTIFREWADDYTSYTDQELRGDLNYRRMWKELLSQLAYRMIQGNAPNFLLTNVDRQKAVHILTNYLEEEKWGGPRESAEKFLDDFLKYNILEKDTDGSIGFPHQLLQEYFAAEYLLGLLPSLADDDLRSNWLNYPKWTEPICLVAQLSEDYGLPSRLLELAYQVDMVLAARIAGAVKAEFQEKTIASLWSQDFPERVKIYLLGESRAEGAIPLLEAELRNRNPTVRESAAVALGMTGLALASLPLSRALFDDYPSVPENAADAMLLIDIAPAADILLGALGSRNSKARWGAAKSLRGLNSERVISALIKVLNDSDGNVRHKAAESLGVIGSEDALEPLIHLLSDPNWHVVGGAGEALGRIGSPLAEEPLLECLFRDHPLIRESAARALGRLGSKKALDILIGQLRSANPVTRRNAAWGLRAFDTEDSVDPLSGALRDNEPSVRATAATALGDMDAGKSFPHLISLLDDPEPSVALAVLESLGKLGKVDAVNTLNELLSRTDSNSPLYVRILKTLSMLGSPQAVASLIDILAKAREPQKIRLSLFLGELGCEEARESLLAMLKHQTWLIRKKAAKCLGTNGDQCLIERLRPLLRETQDLLILNLISDLQNKFGCYDQNLIPWDVEFYILHLSDLHFRGETTADEPYVLLFLDIERKLKPPRIDAIVLSGDMVYQGCGAIGYDPLERFLDKLMNRYGISRDRLVIVPGNHDLDRNSDSDKFGQFRSFYWSVKKKEYPCNYDEQATVEKFPDQKVMIMGLNSAYEEDRDHPRLASINRTALIRGIGQLERDILDDKWLKIVVWHHPLSQELDDGIKDQKFIELLREAGWQIALVGHIHRDSHEKIGSFLTIGAGTFGAPPEELVPAIPWQYNFISIRGNKLSLHIRRKETETGTWNALKEILIEV
jgi:HEAT repeat protein/predicted MPP superfamily phosphohydrolase